MGDNFYEDGVQSTSDPQWRSSFETIYSAPSLQIPWYVALGNHDYRGVPQAQIDYAKISHRWQMPSRYYKVSGGQIGAPHLDLFVIDTSPLVHKYRKTCTAPLPKMCDSGRAGAAAMAGRTAIPIHRPMEAGGRTPYGAIPAAAVMATRPRPPN